MQPADRPLRSVFVGNIPYDTTEEKLKDIFNAVGPVLSFRLVFDRETGKPKGYGFCEYKDQETATSAIRNLNNYDLGGRQLRVDSASNERVRDEPDQQQQQQQQHMPGPNMSLDPSHSQVQMPEPLVDSQTVINTVLCSLPPEQLFDICKQLKSSLMINPNETRQLLAQNPQLSFAILQSLVMIKAIDAETAMRSLHKQMAAPTTLPTVPPMMQPYTFPNPTTMLPISTPDPRLMPTADPRMLPTADTRLLPTTDGRLLPTADGRLLPTTDGRLLPAPDSRLLPAPDSRMLPTPDSRLLPTPDSRLLPAPDTRLLPGPDTRLLPGPDARLLPGPDARLLPTPETRLLPTPDTRLNPADPRLASQYYQT